MKQEFTCFICPRGCHITVKEGSLGLLIEGNGCPRGAEFVKQEVKEPLRILTTSVRTKGLAIDMVSVKTSKAIPKRLLAEAMEIVKNLEIVEPVSVGDIILANILGFEGVNLVATKKVSR